MALVNFIFDRIKFTIKCVKEDKMKNICAKFASEIDEEINSLYFLYNGKELNNELTFYEQANELDRQRLEMNILVKFSEDSNELKCPKCGYNLENIKAFKDLIEYKKYVNNMLNELKSQIESIKINEIENIENKKGICKYLINEIFTKNEIQNKNILNIENKNNTLEKIPDDIYDNCDIKLKKPILKIKAHKEAIWCAIALNDGRFATCSKDGSIVIYNDKTGRPDLIIKEHQDCVYYILQLSSGMLASCSKDKTIKIFNIKYNNYQLLQTLNHHTRCVNKIIELKNKKLVSCSFDSSVIIYSKDNNNKYKKDYKITTNGFCYCVIQTKENEICYDDSHNFNNHSIYFYDMLGKKVIKKISNIGWVCWNTFYMITEDLLLLTGYDKLSLVNVNQYNLVKIIRSPKSSFIFVSCLLNKSLFLTGDYNNHIVQWRINGDNLDWISSKANAHNNHIYSLTKLRNGHILSGKE